MIVDFFLGYDFFFKYLKIIILKSEIEVKRTNLI